MYPNLKMAMWRSGMRQNALARELNLNETVVSKVLNGSRKPSPRMRTILAEFFQQDPEWLFEPASPNGSHNGAANGSGNGTGKTSQKSAGKRGGE